MQSPHITKKELAVALVITKRTLSNYVKEGILPAATPQGREVGWTMDTLKAVLHAEVGGKCALRVDKQQSLNRALTEWASVKTPDVGAGTKTSNSGLTNHPLPEAVVIDLRYVQEHDQRGPCLEKVTAHRAQLDLVHREIRNAKNGSIEQQELWKERNFIKDNIDIQESFLKERFIPLHSREQLISTSELLVSPLFNIRNHNEPRRNPISISLSLAGDGIFGYEGPELRQDDALVFMALLNIMRDIRVDRAAGFAPQALCKALWGIYSGPYRHRLHDVIARLQKGILVFKTFRVPLVQRFDFPARGIWSVIIDKDIVQVFMASRLVWLNLEKRLSMPSGLTSWLYGFILSQSWLMPCKVERLHQQCGSGGKLKGFRTALIATLGLMVSADLIDSGWFINKHDILHWWKTGANSPRKFPTSACILT